MYRSETVLEDVRRGRPCRWLNEKWEPFVQAEPALALRRADIRDAAERLDRFAPLIARLFPETAAAGGRIESPLRETEGLRAALAAEGAIPAGRLFVKLDSHLPVAGSVKARGGIYEVLKHTEDIARERGLLPPGESYATLADHRDVFSQYAVQVGSTGNLGLSIGIASAGIGYRVTVHMSADARQWKKDLLRSKGVEVIEYAGDYGKAVEEGRKRSDDDPVSYFVDDEHSRTLFLGYAVAGERLAAQLAGQGVTVDAEHPLFVYLPCGVGGAPGGITFGLKHVFGDCVHCFFVEPVQCPCVLLGLATGRGEEVCVQDFGLHGRTEADGLAVGRPSGLVTGAMEHLLSGAFTVDDASLYDDLRRLHESEGLFIEPSACAAIGAFRAMGEMIPAYAEERGLTDVMGNATHILWATGGALVPENVRAEYLKKRL